MDPVSSSFDFSSFLVATILFLLLILVVAAILRFIHRRFFAVPFPTGTTANAAGTLGVHHGQSEARFVLDTNGVPVEQSFKPPPLYHIQICHGQKLLKVTHAKLHLILFTLFTQFFYD